MQNLNINSSNSETENVNDEIYPNENFEIKIPNKVRNIINNNNDSHENSFSNCPKSSKKLLISDKKIPEINNIKEEEKHNDVNDNLNSNTKFNNLKISSMLKFEIKSSYDNINEFTKYRFISDISLIKRTKIFLSKECGLLNDLYTKSTNISYQSPILDKKAKSKSTLKLSKCLHNRQIYDYTNGINNLSVVNDNINSPPLFPKELKKLLFKKTKKDNETSNSLKDIRGSDFVQIKRNTTIKEKNVPLNKINSTCINMFSSFSPKKRKRQTEISSDNVVNIKTRNKLDLITENLKRDSQNLNNPNEFYADLFNNFYKQNMKKKKNPVSMPKIKVKQNGKEEKNIIENEEKNEENCLGDS